jgi:hypothetical protein
VAVFSEEVDDLNIWKLSNEEIIAVTKGGKCMENVSLRNKELRDLHHPAFLL